MLKAKAIAQVLAQAATDDVRAALLLQQDGSLISFAGAPEKEAKVIAAVASNVWFAYERNGKPASGGARVGGDNAHAQPPQRQGEGMRSLVLECEHGKLALSKISRMLLCLVAEENVEWGLLNAKTKALQDHLEGPLELVA
ncbi:uncharacterized protein EV422DRAFT_520793 [Fimicolochytrium jonesii]|uniref:uncharacterized protein n=1 Tax=Fimicolochytrium jonesii TaxID=1396493 RepID=UPI0022FDCF90|nr:uncharacterized protein EV422DRAFT_520793 [Fimicolochytrium jonesii]KAI8823369.1 hypothetical protein EV422DRAFT_520793 [Fimicolochytrium jonesii]